MGAESLGADVEDVWVAEEGGGRWKRSATSRADGEIGRERNGGRTLGRRIRSRGGGM